MKIFVFSQNVAQGRKLFLKRGVSSNDSSLGGFIPKSFKNKGGNVTFSRSSLYSSKSSLYGFGAKMAKSKSYKDIVFSFFLLLLFSFIL